MNPRYQTGTLLSSAAYMRALSVISPLDLCLLGHSVDEMSFSANARSFGPFRLRILMATSITTTAKHTATVVANTGTRILEEEELDVSDETDGDES